MKCLGTDGMDPKLNGVGAVCEKCLQEAVV